TRNDLSGSLSRGRRVPDDQERQTLGYIRHLREVGKYTRDQRALRLQKLQIPTKLRNGEWSEEAAAHAYKAALKLGIEPQSELPQSANCSTAVRERIKWHTEGSCQSR